MRTIRYIGKVSDWNQKPIVVGKNLAARLVATGNWVYCDDDVGAGIPYRHLDIKY